MKESQSVLRFTEGAGQCCSSGSWRLKCRFTCGHNEISLFSVYWLWARSRYSQAKTKFLCRSPIRAIKVEGSPQPQASAGLHWALELSFLAICSTDPWRALDQTSLSAPCSVRSSFYLSVPRLSLLKRYLLAQVTNSVAIMFPFHICQSQPLKWI